MVTLAGVHGGQEEGFPREELHVVLESIDSRKKLYLPTLFMREQGVL